MPGQQSMERPEVRRTIPSSSAEPVYEIVVAFLVIFSAIQHPLFLVCLYFLPTLAAKSEIRFVMGRVGINMYRHHRRNTHVIPLTVPRLMPQGKNNDGRGDDYDADNSEDQPEKSFWATVRNSTR